MDGTFYFVQMHHHKFPFFVVPLWAEEVLARRWLKSGQSLDLFELDEYNATLQKSVCLQKSVVSKLWTQSPIIPADTWRLHLLRIMSLAKRWDDVYFEFPVSSDTINLIMRKICWMKRKCFESKSDWEGENWCLFSMCSAEFIKDTVQQRWSSTKSFCHWLRAAWGAVAPSWTCWRKLWLHKASLFFFFK